MRKERFTERCAVLNSNLVRELRSAVVKQELFVAALFSFYFFYVFCVLAFLVK